jgi:alpha-tubulin suppressor-like RCC1 family protein
LDVASPTSEPRFVDTGAAAPQTPSAPTDVIASRVEPDAVYLQWAPVASPLAPRYHYRVVAVSERGESTPSASVEGHLAERPVIGYEFAFDGGPWGMVPGGLVTELVDADAGPPTLEAGTVTASQGVHATHVSLSLIGARAVPGVERVYRVRATTDYGPGAPSANVAGRRTAGALEVAWERSLDGTTDTFEQIDGTSTILNDTGAPGDGSARWYRAIVSASGVDPVATVAASGWRQPPPDVPGGVTATTELASLVRLSWGPVSGAIGYHVYRDGTRLTTSNGVVATTFDDLTIDGPTSSWEAPAELNASSDDPNAVMLSWAAADRPIGPDARYRVRAVNATGEGPDSAEVTGRRAAPAIVGFEVEVSPADGNATWVSTGQTATTWVHTNPPLAPIAGGTISATRGDHRAFVRLSSTGASVGVAPSVAYRVRGVLAGGAGFTPTSQATEGRRSVGPLQMHWQRSSGTTALGFQPLVEATSASRDDLGAPTNGETRWYRVALSAAGAEGVTVEPVEGWRLAFVSVAVGGQHSCGLARDGRMWCWGGNQSGELGRGTTSEGFELAAPMAGQLRARLLAVDYGITFMVDLTGRLWSFGSGLLGVTVSSSLSPIEVAVTGSTSVTVGESFACANDGSSGVWCWGNGGNLGDGSEASSGVPVRVRTSSVGVLAGATKVSNNMSHACGLMQDGAVRCWGSNGSGQLGVSAPAASLFAAPAVAGLVAWDVAAGDGQTCALTSLGGAQCWGFRFGGHTPVAISNLSDAVQITASYAAFCARRATGGVRCWGLNGSGELGNGTIGGTSSVATDVVGLSGVTHLDGGPASFCVVQDFGIRCWGSNFGGQLGDGTTEDRSTAIDVIFP